VVPEDRLRRFGPALVVLAACALLAALAAPLGGAANECKGIQKCIPVTGPWVAVPAQGAVQYLLVCPGGHGIVGGTDALVSSQAVEVSFDGIPGSPVAYGRTTNFEVLFRAVSGSHQPGFFQPFIGCIPTAGSARVTTGVAVVPHGPPLAFKVVRVNAAAGSTVNSGPVRCPLNEHLVDSWTATAFASKLPPAVGVPALITTRRSEQGTSVSASVSAGATLSTADKAFVQLGVRCTPA
jgi:hypothetical protein